MISPFTSPSSASINGLVSDGNALLSAEQSNLDEANYELLRDGTRRRRRPIVQETIDPDTYLGSSTGTFRSSYVWQTPSFKDNMSILVEETNEEIHFYRIDHDNPGYVRDNQYTEDILLLELWGQNLSTFPRTVRGPCTYAEGNGALYIFNPRYDTIKVELTENNRLRFSPITTWVRDYAGADEEFSPDDRKKILLPPQPRYTSTFAGLEPAIFQAGEEYGIPDIGKERLYNLLNSGWDEKAVFACGEAGEWPATTDRYLTGRKVAEDGTDDFSFDQMDKAKKRSNKPPMGACIGHSSRSPCGTPNTMPVDVTNSVTLDAETNTIKTIKFDFTKRQSHYIVPEVNSAHFNLEKEVFIHSFTFTVERNGKTFQGGFSGLGYRAQYPFTDGTNTTFEYVNSSLDGSYSNFTVTSLFVHNNPEYFPATVREAKNYHDKFYSGKRPAAGTYWQGRLWQTADENNRVYFSQTIQSATTFNSERSINVESFCFSEANPTDGDDNALVPTDGGYINTSDSGTHYGIVPLGDSLLLMTDRGIWAIRPGTQGVFSATNYQVSQVFKGEVLGSQAFVSTGTQVHVATSEGILTLQMESTSFGNTSVSVASLTDNRLLTEYNKIIDDWPMPTAAYDSSTQTVRWVFKPKHDSDNEGVGQPILSFSIHHNAFYKYVLSAESRVFEITVLPYTAKTESYNKFRYLIGGLSAPTSNVYLLGWGVEEDGGWSEPLNELEPFADFRPLQSHDGSPRPDVPAFMLTNHLVPGQGMRWAQVLYVNVFNKNVNMSLDDNAGSTLLTVKWDWMDSIKTSKPEETYRFRKPLIPMSFEDEVLEKVLVKKVKVRGRGREYRLLFETNGHKDSHIIGWSHTGYLLNGV